MSDSARLADAMSDALASLNRAHGEMEATGTELPRWWQELRVDVLSLIGTASDAAGFYCEHNALQYRSYDFEPHDDDNPCPEEVDSMAFVILDDNDNPIQGDPSSDIRSDEEERREEAPQDEQSK